VVLKIQNQPKLERTPLKTSHIRTNATQNEPNLNKTTQNEPNLSKTTQNEPNL